MQLIGQNVTHAVFGTGVVTAREGQMMTVQFPAGNKMFLYPEAFSQYLVAQDRALQTEILDSYHAREDARLARERSELARWEKEAALRSRKIPSRSQSAFDLTQEALEAVFSDWTVSTGTYLSGYAKGEPRIPDRLGPNSLCVITVRDGAESRRQIAGLFMARDDFDGSACEDGKICAHPVHRLKLKPDERPLFWPYLTDSESKCKWGSTAFKYLPNEIGEKILRDLRRARPQDEAVRSFYDYFCTLNHLDPVSGK